MGGSPSRPPTPPRLTTKPWRQPADWNKSLEDKILADIRKLSPQQKPSLLLIGPVGAGKSSFINSILSIGKDRKVDKAMTGESAKSFTRTYDRYTDKSLLKNYRLRDCMGIELADEEGFHAEDLFYLVKGHVKDGYTFNPRSPINSSSLHYRADPQFENQTHCVVFVLDARRVHAGIPARYIRKIAILQDKIKTLRIPRVLILTHADSLCQEVDNDVRKMFRSVKVQEAVKTASEVFNIPQASIHPVKNYEVDIELNTATNIPLLLALRQMMQYAEDRAETVLDASDSD